MKANGFGRAVQQIIIQVEQCHSDTVSVKLGVDPFKLEGDPKQAFFAWSKLTTRPGNDEDIVFDLFRILGAPKDGFDWAVLWEASEY